MPGFNYDKRLVGERIQERRLALHLTQEQLAEKIEKSVTTVTDLERGMVGLSIETLFALCDVLEVTPNWLLLPHAELPETEVEWLLQVLPTLSEHHRHTAIELVKTYIRSL